MNDNFKAVIEALDLTRADIRTLAKNSFGGSFLSDGEKRAQIAAVEMV
jgi:adenosine deaminase